MLAWSTTMLVVCGASARTDTSDALYMDANEPSAIVIAMALVEVRACAMGTVAQESSRLGLVRGSDREGVARSHLPRAPRSRTRGFEERTFGAFAAHKGDASLTPLHPENAHPWTDR